MVRLGTFFPGNEDNEQHKAHQEFPEDWDPDAAGFDRAEAVVLVVGTQASRSSECEASPWVKCAARTGAKTLRS